MKILSIVLLLLWLGLLFYVVRRSKNQYEYFKSLTSTVERQRVYKKMVIGSFLFYGIGSIITLIIIGKLNVIFRTDSQLISSLSMGESVKKEINGELKFIGVIVAIEIPLIYLFTRLKVKKRKRSVKLPTIGDVNALIPKNKAERKIGVIISANAGLSEEIFFRAMLPLLFYYSIGNAYLSVALSCLIFGLVHWYQKWKGILVTGILGVIQTCIYVFTGQLWIAILIHIFIDLNAFVFRPMTSTYKPKTT
ncbi:MAG: CPBP family intramembrane glutamic endopeptidase [Acidimicrobiia bacterium]